MWIDFYNVLETFIPSIFSAFIIVTIGAVIISITGRWKQFFFSHKEYVRNVLFLLVMIIVFFLVPDSDTQKYFRIVIVVGVVSIILIKILGKERVIFPKNILLKHWGKTTIIKGTRRYNLLYAMLSSYEKTQVDLEEVKSSYQQQPYEAYRKLKKMNIAQWNSENQYTYYQILCATLIELGAYAEAKVALEKMQKKDSEDLATLSLQCVLYERTGNVQLAMEMARKAYQRLVVETSNVDSSIVVQVYHNYACFLIRDYQINKGLDIMKDAVDYALKEEKSVILDRTVGDYLTYVYKLNPTKFKGEKRCFFCLSCMNVAFAHSMDIDNYLGDILVLMKEECKELEVLKRVRFYSGLSNVVDFYPVQCKNNHYSMSKYYSEVVQLYNDYCNNMGQKELYQSLENTDSIWINQKCELRKMIIQHQKWKEGYDFEEIYKQYMQLYREREASDSVMDMLSINIDIIDECMRNIEDEHVPLQLVRTAKKDILLEHLEKVENLLERINYDVVYAEHAETLFAA